jgi:hypothetical protein
VCCCGGDFDVWVNVDWYEEEVVVVVEGASDDGSDDVAEE